MSVQEEPAPTQLTWVKYENGGPEAWRHTAVACNSEIYTFGGYCPGAHSALRVNHLDTDEKTWTELTSRIKPVEENIPPRLISPSAVTFRGKVYVWGGLSVGKSNVLYRLNPARLEWDQPVVVGPIPRGRDEHSCCIIGSNMYVFSGIKLEDYSADKWTDLHHLNLSSKELTWTTDFSTLTHFPNSGKNDKRELHVCVAIGSKLYIFGSVGGFLPFVRFHRYVTYDTATGLTTTAEQTNCHPHPRRGAAIWEYKGRIWVYGGKRWDNLERRSDLFYLDLESKQWTKLKVVGDTPEPTIYHCACMKDGSLFVIGGRAVSPHYAISQTLELKIENSKEIAEPCFNVYCPKCKASSFIDEQTERELFEDVPETDAVTVRKVLPEDEEMRKMFQRAITGGDEKSLPKHSAIYRMSRQPRGRAVIFNNEEFDHLPKRDGSQKDVDKLRKLFEGLSFQVVEHHNKTCEEMMRLLTEEVNDKRHRLFDCFVLFVLSHGDKEGVFGKDGKEEKGMTYGAVSEIEIKELLATSPYLQPIPKILLFQACRGHQSEHRRSQGQVQPYFSLEDSKPETGHRPHTPPPQIPPPHTPPPHTPPPYTPPPAHPPPPSEEDPSMTPGALRGDIELESPTRIETEQPAFCVSHSNCFTANSASYGFTAYRDRHLGSWFAQAIVHVFSNFAYRYDLFQLMRMVNYRVREKEFEGNAQDPEFATNFSKNLYFFPGLPDKTTPDQPSET